MWKILQNIVDSFKAEEPPVFDLIDKYVEYIKREAKETTDETR